ncbi:MAG: IPT/TIG domain-containing protein, partial [Terriglobales bacterium]
GTSFITATVPAGALTGSVTVTTGSSALTSSRTFNVLPTITSIPSSGSVGTPVAIEGTGLTQTTKVTFGGVKATSFTVNSDTQVTAYVPTGAKTGKIAVTTQGGSATSKTTFTVN